MPDSDSSKCNYRFSEKYPECWTLGLEEIADEVWKSHRRPLIVWVWDMDWRIMMSDNYVGMSNATDLTIK